MSWCRPDTDCDLYIYETASAIDGKTLFDCQCCPLGNNLLDSQDAMVQHVAKHIDAGHKVPSYLRERVAEWQAGGVEEFEDDYSHMEAVVFHAMCNTEAGLEDEIANYCDEDDDDWSDICEEDD